MHSIFSIAGKNESIIGQPVPEYRVCTQLHSFLIHTNSYVLTQTTIVKNPNTGSIKNESRVLHVLMQCTVCAHNEGKNRAHVLHGRNILYTSQPLSCWSPVA